MPTPTPRWTGPAYQALCQNTRAPRTRHCLRMRMLSDLRPRERASEPSHNVLASTLLPRRRVCGSNFQDQSGEIVQVQWLTGAPEEIRTPDPQIRSYVLTFFNSLSIEKNVCV